MKEKHPFCVFFSLCRQWIIIRGRHVINAVMTKLNITAVILTLLVLAGCKKADVEGAVNELPISIYKTTTAGTTTQAAGITTTIGVTGNNLCWRLKSFNIKEVAARVYEIDATGTFPAGNPVCAEAVYYKDSAITIMPLSKGQHLLKFYNRGTLLKTDTVQVN